MRGPVAALSLALALAWPARALEVDLELTLAVDMSGSMDREEQQLQRDGYVEAIASPEVWDAIAGGAWGRIALSYVEWAGPASQVVVLDWRLIDSAEAAADFAAALAARPLSYIRGTSISGALDFVAPRFDDNGFEGWRRVIDLSGDGPNNRGRPVEAARDAALARGVVINGLPILIRPTRMESDLAAYYEACVIGGDGAFVLPVRRAADFAAAIRRKLVLEIAVPTPPPRAVPAAAPPEPVDCLAGERLRRLWSDP
jgi:hypothetical protein